jgi:hypothetical protein
LISCIIILKFIEEFCLDKTKLGLPIFFSKPVATRAIKVVLIVGVILAFINHGNLIEITNITTEYWMKILLIC